MTKRFTAVVIIANFIVGTLLYLSSQEMLIHLASNNPVLTLTALSIDKINIGAIQGPSSPTPLIISSFPNYPFYALLLPLIANAYFIARTIKSPDISKKLPIIISAANIVTSLLTYLSIETTLLSFVGSNGSYTGIYGVSFWSYGFSPVSVGGQIIPLWAAVTANFTSYIFLFFVVMNACFTIKLLISKSK